MHNLLQGSEDKTGLVDAKSSTAQRKIDNFCNSSVNNAFSYFLKDWEAFAKG